MPSGRIAFTFTGAPPPRQTSHADWAPTAKMAMRRSRSIVVDMTELKKKEEVRGKTDSLETVTTEWKGELYR